MRIFIFILLFGIYTPLSAQFNVAVGYSMGYTNADETNALVDDFNKYITDSLMIVGEPMEELHFLHGINVGLRWKYESFALELNWENMNRTRESVGENSQDQLFQKTVFYAINNYSASLESRRDILGVGLAAGIRKFKLKEEIASTGKRFSFHEETQYFIKPFISINVLGGDKVGLSIKPYFSIPFNSISLDPLSKEFDLGPSDREERLWMGGVTFVFYNGRQ